MKYPHIVRNTVGIRHQDLKLGTEFIKKKLDQTKKLAEEIFKSQGWVEIERYETFSEEFDGFPVRKIPKKAEDCYGPFQYTYTIVGKQ